MATTTATTKTTQNKAVKGWTNIKAPKTDGVSVADWLRENGLTDDADNIKEGTTFQDFARCITGRTPQGLQEVDGERLADLTRTGYCDSFLRDVIFDSLAAI